MLTVNAPDTYLSLFFCWNSPYVASCGSSWGQIPTMNLAQRPQ